MPAKRAEDTQEAVREAMARYEAMVLHERNLDARTGLYRYPQAISASEVLRMAGVQSRATLSAGYHDGLKRELDELISALKCKTGKGKPAKAAAAVEAISRPDRLDQLAQTIAALQFRIIELENENAALRASQGTGKVVSMKRPGKLRRGG